MDTNQTKQALIVATPDEELIRVLGQSLYPGARKESIRLVLAWCKATGRDPMKKPIHIVPMEVKDAATGKKEWRDVLMPGIGTYRSDAANSGSYGGIDEPEFGPELTENIDGMEITYPQWCRVTVYRIVDGEKRAFTAKEYWIENYASGYQGKGVNAMWRKRRYGQLAKVAEAQALRKAFPDETGQTNTTDEMEGKTFHGETIDATADEPIGGSTRKEQHRAVKSERYQTSEDQTDSQTDDGEAERISAFMVETDKQLTGTKNGTVAFKILLRAFENAPTLDDLVALEAHPFRKHVRVGFPPILQEQAQKAFDAAAARLSQQDQQWETPAETASDLAGEASNETHATGEANEAGEIQAKINNVADALKAEKTDQDDDWPGPR